MISILFGAGASKGADVTSTPPLGCELFLSLESLGGAFNALPSEIKKSFINDGFEVGMGMVANDSSVISPLQNELAIFLSSFTASESNAYYLLFSKINKYFEYLNLITLNYDLVIESSLFRIGYQSISYDIENMSSRARLMKLHGSSNFVPDIQGSIKGVRFLNCGTFLETDKIKILTGHDDIKRWCERNESFSPIMCMYNKEKRAVINQRYINGLKKSYSEVIRKSNAIVIVGIKYVPHDNHVWDKILSEGAYLLLVDPFPDSDFLNLLSKRKIRYTLLKKSFHLSVDDIYKFLSSRLERKVTKII